MEVGWRSGVTAGRRRERLAQRTERQRDRSELGHVEAAEDRSDEVVAQRIDVAEHPFARRR